MSFDFIFVILGTVEIKMYIATAVWKFMILLALKSKMEMASHRVPAHTDPSKHLIYAQRLSMNRTVNV